jgi:hypothetical protein
MEPGSSQHRKRSRPSRLVDEIPIPKSTSHPCPACGSVFSSLKYRDLHLHHQRDCMATYQQLNRTSSPPALNVRLTGGPFGQHNDAEDVAAQTQISEMRQILLPFPQIGLMLNPLAAMTTRITYSPCDVRGSESYGFPECILYGSPLV